MNLGSGKETHTIDLANTINQVTENQGGIKSIGKRDWDKSSRRVASIDKAKKILDYSPEISLEEGLEKTRDWFLGNKDKIEESAMF